MTQQHDSAHLHDHDDHEHSHTHEDEHEHHEHEQNDPIEHDHLQSHTHANEHRHDDHTPGHSHDHNHDHDHGHSHEHGRFGWLIELIPGMHGHSHGEASVDAALEENARGIWAIKISLLGLGATALFQVIIALLSGSAGLLADTIHNAADALTAIPLWIAFVLGRRAANQRYTYGYGRAEDLALVGIVVLVCASAILAAITSVQKLIHPHPLSQAGWVIVAALVGCLGNEAVGWFRISVGQEIGSAALIADGQHARIDGLTSLAVLIGAIGSLLGFTLADPIIGLIITVAILFILKDIATTMWYRLMDAVDPALVTAILHEAGEIPGVIDAHDVRMRWIGHKLQTDLHVTVDEELTTRESHRIAEEVRHALFHEQPRLAVITVHVDPSTSNGDDHHALNAHHEPKQPAQRSAGKVSAGR